MKILKNNYNQEIEQTKQIAPYPRNIVCENCQSELEYEESDIRVGAYGLAYLNCPLCKHENILDNDEHEITLTMDNVEFPVHFHHTSTENAVDYCNNENVKKYIREAINYFRTNKEEFSWGQHQIGNLYINVLRYDGDENYVITVSNDFYQTDIPFESKDY